MKRHRFSTPPNGLRSIHQPSFDNLLQQVQFDLAGVAICPLCQGPMIARQGRRGPYFHCYCFVERQREAVPLPRLCKAFAAQRA